MKFNKIEYIKDVKSIIFEENLEIELIFISKVNINGKKEIKFDKIIIDDNLQDKIINNFRKKITRLNNNKLKTEYHEYDPLLKDNSVKYLNKKNDKLIEFLLSDGLNSIKKFDKNMIKFVKGSIIKISNTEKELLFFRKLTKSSFIEPTGAAFFKRGILTESKQNLFKIELDFDFFWFDDNLVILRDGLLRSLFNLIKKYEKTAKIILEHFEKKLDFKIEDFKNFEKICLNDYNLILRLNDIKDKNIYPKINFKSITKIIKNYKLPIEIDSEKKLIHFDSKKGMSAWSIINLFNDRNLKSELTGIKYDAPVKRKIS